MRNKRKRTISIMISALILALSTACSSTVEKADDSSPDMNINK